MNHTYAKKGNLTWGLLLTLLGSIIPFFILGKAQSPISSRLTQALGIATGVTLVSHFYLTYGNKPLITQPSLDDLNVATFHKIPHKAIAQETTIEEIRAQMADKSFKHAFCPTDPGNMVEAYTSVPCNHKGTIFVHLSGPAFCPRKKKTDRISSSANSLYKIVKAGVIKKAPAVSFSSPGRTERRAFNFGQALDQHALNQVIEAIINKNPDAAIVLMGTCLGATTILNYLANPHYNAHHEFDHIKAVLIESPGISFDHLMNHMSNAIMPALLHDFIPWVLKKYFPNYHAGQSEKEILASYAHIPAHIQFFISSLPEDHVTALHEIKKITEKLQEHHATVELFISNNHKIRHGHLGPDKEFQRAIKRFIAKYHLDQNNKFF